MILDFENWLNESYKPWETLAYLKLKEEIREEIEKQGIRADLNHLDISKVTDMRCLFGHEERPTYETKKETEFKFNGDISKWDVSHVKNMSCMFNQGWAGLGRQDRNDYFNGDISKWNVSNVTDMSYMFYLSPFDGDISKWNVSRVRDMNHMFSRFREFRTDISKWNISRDCNVESFFEVWNKPLKDISLYNIPLWVRAKLYQENSKLFANISENEIEKMIEISNEKKIPLNDKTLASREEFKKVANITHVYKPWQLHKELKTPSAEDLKKIEDIVDDLIEKGFKDEPGSVWYIYESTAADERHFPVNDEDDDEDDDRYWSDWNSSGAYKTWSDKNKATAVRVEAPSALAALATYVQVENDGSIWSNMDLVDYEKENWNNGVPESCNDSNFCDWNFDDGMDDVDSFHWRIICIKKIEGPTLSGSALDKFNDLPYSIRKKFASSKSTPDEFFHQHRGAVAGKRFGV